MRMCQNKTFPAQRKWKWHWNEGKRLASMFGNLSCTWYFNVREPKGAIDSHSAMPFFFFAILILFVRWVQNYWGVCNWTRHTTTKKKRRRKTRIRQLPVCITPYEGISSSKNGINDAINRWLQSNITFLLSVEFPCVCCVVPGTRTRHRHTQGKWWKSICRAK